MASKIKLELTRGEMARLLDIITTIEGMYGCSDGLNDGVTDWDSEMRKNIKKFDNMLNKNGLKRT